MADNLFSLDSRKKLRLALGMESALGGDNVVKENIHKLFIEQNKLSEDMYIHDSEVGKSTIQQPLNMLSFYPAKLDIALITNSKKYQKWQFFINPHTVKVSYKAMTTTILSEGGYRTQYWDTGMQMVSESWSGVSGNLSEEGNLQNFEAVAKLVAIKQDLWLGYEDKPLKKGILTSFDYSRTAESALMYTFDFTFLVYPNQDLGGR